jgi:hypothetical protein
MPKKSPVRGRSRWNQLNMITPADPLRLEERRASGN